MSSQVLTVAGIELRFMFTSALAMMESEIVHGDLLPPPTQLQLANMIGDAPEQAKGIQVRRVVHLHLLFGCTCFACERLHS